MKRTRQELDGTRRYGSPSEFLSAAPTTGAHAIRHAGQWIDLQYVDRGAPRTMIGFHSSLGAKNLTLPMFSGGTLAADAGMNYIGVSDASLCRGAADLAWYLGNIDTGPLPPVLTPLIKHLLEGREAVLFGASGGGYSAVLYAQKFPDSTVVVANPRLNMIGRPEANIASYAKACHDALGTGAMKRMRDEYVTEDLAATFQGGLPFDLVLMQNQGDEEFLEGQAKPFLSVHGGDPRLTYVELQNGPGHVVVPRRSLLEQLREVAGGGVP